MKSVNKVILLGNLGHSPEIKYLPSGTPVCSFSIATGEKYTNKSGQEVNNIEWTNIVVFEKLAEIANQYLKKGSKVYIEGRLKTDSYEKDGVKKYNTKVIANDIVFLDKKEESITPTINDEPPTTDFTPPQDDIPF